MVAFVVRMTFRGEAIEPQASTANGNDVYKAVNTSSLSVAARGAAGNHKEPVEKFQKRLNRVKLKVFLFIFK